MNYLEKIIKQGSNKYKNSNEAFNQRLILYDFEQSDKSIFVVLPNLYEAQKYYDGLSNLIDDHKKVLFYPTDQTLTTLMALGSPEFRVERIYTLRQLLTGDKCLVIMTEDGYLRKQLSPLKYRENTIIFFPNKTYSFTDVIRKLVDYGYSRTYLVEKPGDFSVRGNILDIYPLDHDSPYRLDFFGSELESIKIFDINTQISEKHVATLAVIPIHEIFFSEEEKISVDETIRRFFDSKRLSELEQEKLDKDLKNLSNRQKVDTLITYLDFFSTTPSTISDFADAKSYYIDVYKMKINHDRLEEDHAAYEQTMQGKSFLQISHQKPFESMLSKSHIEISNLGVGNHDFQDLEIVNIASFNGSLELLYETIRPYLSSYKLSFSMSTPELIESLTNYLLGKEIANYEIVGSFNSNSYISMAEKTIIITEETIFNTKKRSKVRYRSVLNQSTKIKSHKELSVGDYVVHYDYGIAKYMGLKTMGLSGQRRDYLVLIYAADEILYIPVDQVELVLKYSSYEGYVPKLTKLGGKTWNQAKAKARKQIKDLSDKLLKLYAARANTLGFKFSEDSELQKELENDFEFTETPDQKKAIEEVKKDMESIRPMDRLILGDVGFGKTEVAIRATFKAVLDAKQVAYLVPTTVLARQHYYTFKKRLEKYGVSVELMSRFVSKAQQNEIIERLKKGLVDVVIGTHRLLSKDINFKDLGLMIVDEEQRFGVEDKEKIKEMKINVDTLVLSATPIPRTLQMSIVGLKDMSMIETPPENRYPVQTYVVARDKSLTQEAIRRELARGGQVFYLYNRVADMEKIVDELSKLIPEARIAYAHGKMSKHQLEKVLSDFIDHEYDVLVSTTIIETGIDIPNTNTLLIHEADRLGLSQLYQIRGRVGRSDKIAYAYLFYDQRKNINDEALKRLSVIEDFTALGSGYDIALRDLAIRGAGDILGREQSGFIDSVGIDLYTKLLEEAVTGVPIELDEKRPQEESYTNHTIDEDYINSDSIRLEIHKRINKQTSLIDLKKLELELVDRFGNFDMELIEYMYEKLFNQLCMNLGIEKHTKYAQEVNLVFSLEQTLQIDGIELFRFANTNMKYKMSLRSLKNLVGITVSLKNNHKHWLIYMCEFLEDLSSHILVKSVALS